MEWANSAGDVLEELYEAEKLEAEREAAGIWTFSQDCGEVYSLICC